MKIKSTNRLTLAVSVLLLTASQSSLVQAADNYYSGQAESPMYNPGYQSNPAQSAPAYDAQGYAAPGYAAPAYEQPYYQPNYQPYYGRRNYDRGSNFSPWGGNSPSFSGPWDGGRGNSMPWNSGRGGSGPSFSGPWDGGRGNSMPWNSGRGGDGPSFSGPWNSGRGNSMPW